MPKGKYVGPISAKMADLERENRELRRIVEALGKRLVPILADMQRVFDEFGEGLAAATGKPMEEANHE